MPGQCTGKDIVAAEVVRTYVALTIMIELSDTAGTDFGTRHSS
jgi:hypothetical protein